ncbi:DUF1579 domain-containing protein [Aridibaculum aurantiacum]|uniref:DUF1579 domain-containing protein n=1 Tax=Aridibaculum aurantiacum TaxID=2810307 RepID=UPI001A96DFC4|nr:DUF1579 domain-containing protein [Aridibaculum aurantiacum]
MNEKFEQSKTDGAHLQLSRMVGDWEGTTRVWFDPAKLEDESPISGTMRLILDGRFIMHEYKSKFGEEPITGMAIYGYHLDLQKFQCAWIDSFHNGSAIMFSEGKRGDQNLNILGSYSYVTPEMEQHWGWRTTIELITDSEMVITAYNVSPEGGETKATETVYKKVQ